MLETRLATTADAATLAELAATVFCEAYRSAFASDQQVAEFIQANFSLDVLHAELATGHVAISLREMSLSQTGVDARLIARSEMATSTGRGAYTLGYVNGVAAGFVKMESTAPPECVGCRPAMELAKLYVLRAFHGSGIANELMQRGLEHASRDGVSLVWLCVWEKNARALSFYRRWGFESVGEQEFQWSGVVFRDAVMTRRVTPATTNVRRRKVDGPFTSDAEIATLVARFEAATLPYERWTHRAHLAVGLTYVRAMPLDAALIRMRQHIQHYNQSCGDPTGYNETVTILFLRKIASCCCESHDSRPLHVLLEDLVQGCSVEWLYRYYSKERIWSAAAKQSWIEPDRQPLDF